jgi:hypothetical protein
MTHPAPSRPLPGVQPTAAQQALLQRSGELRTSLQNQATSEIQRWAPAGRRVGTWVAVGQRVVRAVRQPAVLAGLAAAGVALWLWRRPSRAATVERSEPVAANASRLLGWAMFGWRVWQVVQRLRPPASTTARHSNRTDSPMVNTVPVRDRASGPAPSRRAE